MAKATTVLHGDRGGVVIALLVVVFSRERKPTPSFVFELALIVAGPGRGRVSDKTDHTISTIFQDEHRGITPNLCDEITGFFFTGVQVAKLLGREG